jgi:hypothetical protein
MNFSPAVKAWILLITLTLSAGGAVFMTTYLGGAKIWYAVVAGLITGASNVYHALANSPNDAAAKPTPNP